MLRNAVYWLIVLAVCLSLASVSCTPSPAVQTTALNWKMSVITSEDSSWAKGTQKFADLIRQHSGGKMQITVYPNGSLASGDQVKELSMLREGSIDFTYHSNLLYTNLDQSYAVISLPLLFSGYTQIDAALSGPAGSKLLKTSEDLGIVGLA